MGAIHALDQAELIERPSADNQAPHQTRPDQQVGVHAHDTLGQCEVFLLLADQLVDNRDDVARDRESAQRDLRPVRDRPNHFSNTL